MILDYNITFATMDEYIGENREVITGLSYFVHSNDLILNPYLVPSPDVRILKENIRVTSYKTEEGYKLYNGTTQKYDLTYSLYVIGEISLEKGAEIIASVVQRWRTYTNNPSTHLDIVNVEPSLGDFGYVLHVDMSGLENPQSALNLHSSFSISKIMT